MNFELHQITKKHFWESYFNFNLCILFSYIYSNMFLFIIVHKVIIFSIEYIKYAEIKSTIENICCTSHKVLTVNHIT